MITSHELQQTCPCCGHFVDTKSTQWNEEMCTLTGPAGAITLTKAQGRIFSILWRARETGRIISRLKMLDEIYAHDPSGGPESDKIIDVHMTKIRKKLKDFPVEIVTHHGHGFLLRVVQ
jgi:DNA-binding response OmpR family regulator